MDASKISEYNEQVVAVVYDHGCVHTPGVVRDSIFYEIKIFDPSARESVLLVPLNPHRIDQVIPISQPSDLEKGVLDAFLSGENKITFTFPLKIQPRKP